MELLTQTGIQIDIDRCLNAMEALNVQGAPRLDRIEEAIGLIQKDGTCLRKRYIGVKQYAGFGDQNSDNDYGYGPSHGSIVFQIERVRNNMEAVLGSDHIYLLECVRDFGAWADDAKIKRLYNLCDTLREWGKAVERVVELEKLLANAKIETHS